MFILRMFIAVNKRVRIFIEDVIAIDFVFESTHNLYIKSCFKKHILN